MRSADDIKNSIRNLNATANADTHQRVLDDLLKIMQKSKKQPSAHKPTWRIIMKSNNAKLAAAALIVIAVLIGINQFGTSIDGSSIAWADVQRALGEVNWMHLVQIPNDSQEKNNMIRGETSQVTWIAFKSKIAIVEYSNGKISYYCHNEGTQYVYNPGDGIITKSVISDETFPFGSAGPIELFRQLLEKEQEKGRTVSRQVGKYKGSEVEIWEVKNSDNNERIINAKLFIDINKNLPLAIKIEVENRGKAVGPSVGAEFEYPAQGPRDIYEAGAPRSAKIVD
jgi:hypothetical protein